MVTFSVNPESTLNANIHNWKPTTDAGREWMSTVWMKAVDGKAEVDSNIDAYGATCAFRQRQAKIKREVQIVTADEADQGIRGISEAVLSYYEDGIDAVEEREDFKYALQELVEKNELLRAKTKYDLIACLIEAIWGNKAAVENLKNLISRFDLGDMIQDILRMPNALKILESLE